MVLGLPLACAAQGLPHDAQDVYWQVGVAQPKPWQPPQCMTCDDVKRVQESLVALGYDPGPIDGLVGPRTVSALRKFESDNGLPVRGQLSSELMTRIGAGAAW